MNDEQPYNDEQWHGLPLPDADKAWQKMETLLDEEERRPLLAWRRWRIAAVVLLLLSVAVGGWLWLNSGSKKEEETRAKRDTQQTIAGRNQDVPTGANQTTVHKQASSVQKTTALPNEKTVADLKTLPQDKATLTPQDKEQQRTAAFIDGPEKAVPSSQKQKKASVQEFINTLPWARSRTKTAFTNKKARRLAFQQAHRNKPTPVVSGKPTSIKAALRPFDKLMVTTPNETDDENVSTKTAEQAGAMKKAMMENANTEVQKKDSMKASVVAKRDSTSKKDSIKVVASPPVVQTVKKTSSKKQPAFVFSGGIGLQQGIALHNTALSPPDSTGRKRAFFNYFPSLYVKLQRDKWAAQAEFQYSVPQSVANVSFNQKTTYDPATAVLYTERYSVQKLYYHQLPFSLSYSVRPQWSVAIGGVYNILAGAVTEEEFVSRNVVTGAETIGKNSVAVKGYNDSFFYKTTAGLLVQTDYQWKRFSLGLRYTQNLQPFIKFTNPDGSVRDEKSDALQAVLRFRLFKTKTGKIEMD